MELAAGLIGVVVGAGVTVAVAWLDRRWRREDVRAAEKRVRLEERLEPVRAYAAALCEFVSNVASLMSVWAVLKPDDNGQRIADIIRIQLEEASKKLEAAEPQPAPRFVLRDGEANAWLLGLELLAMESKDACMAHLKDGTVADAAELQSWVARADDDFNELLERMEYMLQEPD